ncbi:MAG: ester cyclase [Actinomycetota bacterium]|nr:ester cyclase [Actinomycetota bacterium]
MRAPRACAVSGSFRTAFPDLEIQVEELVADDGKVAIAYTVSGTHQGDFEGHAPTGKRMSVRGLQLTRIEDGMVVERWGMSDQLTIHKQLGLVSETV